MDYAFCGEQDFGIDDIQTAFDATDNDMIIKKDSTKIVTSKTAKAIMYGDVTLNNTLAKEANRVGLIGYWDKSNFIICAGKNYSFIIDEIKSMIVPKHCRFGFTQGFMGRGNLVILKI